MGKLIELVAETFEAFGAVGVCTVLGGIALFAIIQVTSGNKEED